jgi:hypothetical protein
MSPVGYGYSSMSDEEINDPYYGHTLSATDITPQIAGQWLYNVKGFRWTRVIAGDDPQTGTVVENLYAVNPISFPPPALNDLKINPQLRFYEQYAPNQYLKASTNNDLYYYSTGSSLSTRYLETFSFIKNQSRWCVGVSKTITTQVTEVIVDATLTQAYTKFTYANGGPYDPNTVVENFYDITDTFY